MTRKGCELRKTSSVFEDHIDIDELKVRDTADCERKRSPPSPSA
jgi:hypothetical protein